MVSQSRAVYLAHHFAYYNDMADSMIGICDETHYYAFLVCHIGMLRAE
jgi:hypothetical protein